MAAVTIADHLRVAFRLAGRDGAAGNDVANSPSAFWYSFQAAVVSLPLFFSTLLLDPDRSASLAYAVGQLGPYVVSWLLFPVAMLYVAELIDRTAYYCRYIALVNWCSVVEYVLLALLVILRVAGILPSGIAGLLFFGVVVWVFMYQHFVARVALQVDWAGAALIVGLRLVLELVVVAASAIFE